MNNRILKADIKYTFEGLSQIERKNFENAVILITGCGGFLGQYYLSFFEELGDLLGIQKVIGIDTFLLGKSPLVHKLETNALFDIRTLDVKDFAQSDLSVRYDIDYVFHMASIASPSFYRKYPLETIDSNILGIRTLLDAFQNRNLKGFLFYSSSEVYGDPDPGCVPTPEDYFGNVATLGPRACYDESKRFGETLCWVYHKLYQMPIRIVRLFNVYGPGLKINDRRAPADFAQAILSNRDIPIYSNGQPKRTFCYVADSTIGEIKAIMSPAFDVFNIGSGSEEMTIYQLAELYRAIGAAHFGYNGRILYETSADPEYLVHDPQRRCPDLTKTIQKLRYNPQIAPAQGVLRYLKYLKEEGKDAEW